VSPASPNVHSAAVAVVFLFACEKWASNLPTGVVGFGCADAAAFAGADAATGADADAGADAATAADAVAACGLPEAGRDVVEVIGDVDAAGALSVPAAARAVAGVCASDDVPAAEAAAGADAAVAPDAGWSSPSITTREPR